MASVILDVAERLILLALYAWLVARIVPSVADGSRPLNGLILASEGVIVVFMLLRRTTSEVSRKPSEWLLAMAATCGPLLVTLSPGEPLVSPGLALGLWLAGNLIQLSAKLALGRSLGCVPAHRGLKRGGPYRYVRHPMYAGYLLSHAASLLINPTLGNLMLYALCDGLQVPRIFCEERLLGRDPEYRAYRDDVPWRIFPGVF